MSWSLSWLIVSTCTILVQQKLDILVPFTNSVLHWSVQSEFMFQTSKLVFQDISIASIFIQFVCPCPCSVFQFDVEVFLGMVACPPCTSDFLRWPGYAVLVFSLIKPWEIVQSDLHTCTSVNPSIIVATCGYSLTCHIWKVSSLSSKWVWVWYIHATYTTSSWPWLLLILIWEQTWLICAEMWIASISLSETYQNSKFSQRVYLQTALQVHALRAAY